MRPRRLLSLSIDWKRTTTCRTYIQTSKFPTITKKNNSPIPDGEQSPGSRPNQGIKKILVVRRIIGVDPGLASTGWGVVELRGNKVVYLAHGCISTKAGLPRSERLFSIYTEIRAVLDTYLPTEGSIETLYFAKNITSALPVAEARGVLCMAMAEKGLPVREFTPMAIKQAVVGRGAADKKQVQELVRLILGLAEIPKPDHAADALGAALCCAHTLIP